MSDQPHHKPPRRESVNEKVRSPRSQRQSTTDGAVQWKYYGPSVVQWEVTSCFTDGYLFLLIDPISRQWALYNDTFTYEMHAVFIFSTESHIQPMRDDRVVVRTGSDGTTCVAVTVYPMETVTFLRAERQRYRCSFEGKALSQSYLDEEREAAAALIAQAFSAILGDGDGEDAVASASAPAVDGESLMEDVCLSRCLERGLPFVDPVFFPGDHSLWPHHGPTTPSAHSFASLPRTPLQRTGSVSVTTSDADVPLRDGADRRESVASRCGPSTVPSALTPCAWQRPCEYLPPSWRDRIEVFRGPVTPRCVQRGRLGNAWFVSALAAVAESDSHVRALFGRSSRQTAEMIAEEAVGAYRVILNRDGWWHELLLDAYLPTVGRQPRYAKSRDDPCELWVSLLEKAYAKRNGAYANIVSGDPLFAFRDLTGFPTTRLDTAYLKSGESMAASQAFFSRLASDFENGHLYLLSTPNSCDPRGAAADFRSNGILVGYAYTVIGTFAGSGEHRFTATAVGVGSTMSSVNALPHSDAPSADVHTRLVHLLVLRNPWAPAGQWKGRWRVGSPLWDQHTAAAVALPGCAAGTDDTIAVEWPEEVHRFFVGCGMAHCHFGFADYRMPCTFVRHVPNVCVEVSVTEPTSLTFILSQRDHRGTREQGKDYAPVVLCVASLSSSTSASPSSSALGTTCTTSEPSLPPSPPPVSSPPKEEYTVLVHSSCDAESPNDHCTFLQARDISIAYTFDPAHSPYVVVPRRLMLTPTAATNTTTAALADSVAQAAETEQEELPFVLGVLSQLPFTPMGQAQLRLRRLHESNPVFQNYATFPSASTEAPMTVMAQRRVGCGSVVKVTSSLNSL